MTWVRWIGLLIVLLSLVCGMMVGRALTALHLAQPAPVEFNPLNQGTTMPPSDPMGPVWTCLIASAVALVLLAPAIYLLGRGFPRLAPYLVLLVVAAGAALPVLFELLKHPSARNPAPHLRYADLLASNSFFCVMGTLFGTALLALADGARGRASPAAEKVPHQPKGKKKPARPIALPTELPDED